MEGYWNLSEGREVGTTVSGSSKGVAGKECN